MTHASLFSGIGGFDLAAEWAGWENIFHCEWNPFGQKVLAHHFPNSKSYNDITKTDFSIHAGQIDVLTGGFPCQPYSVAGLRKGKADERHLFPEMLRAIKEIQPRYVVGENVRGLVSWGGGVVFNEVCADLESEGYAVQPFIIPAASVNAPHRRDRIWFVAYSNDQRGSSRLTEISRKNAEISERNNNAESSNSSTYITTDSDNQKRWREGDNNREWSNQKQESYDRNELRNNVGSISKSTDVTNTNNIISKYKYIKTDKRWQEFPTVSPICNGNDGLPNGLDNITFSKWRKETIKAGGNAIVPQVAFEIFKAINQFESLPS